MYTNILNNLECNPVILRPQLQEASKSFWFIICRLLPHPRESLLFVLFAKLLYFYQKAPVYAILNIRLITTSALQPSNIAIDAFALEDYGRLSSTNCKTASSFPNKRELSSYHFLPRHSNIKWCDLIPLPSVLHD